MSFECHQIDGEHVIRIIKWNVMISLAILLEVEVVAAAAAAAAVPPSILF